MKLEPAALAKLFHETYERLAPKYGYETRVDSAVPWEQVPKNNRDLMTAVCAELLSLAPLEVRDPITAYQAAEEAAAALRGLGVGEGWKPDTGVMIAGAWRELAQLIASNNVQFAPPRPASDER